MAAAWHAALAYALTGVRVHLADREQPDLDALVGLKLYQQAPNLTLTNHMAFPGVIAVSKKWWDARSDAERSMVGKVIADAERWGYRTAIDADLSNLEKARAGGVTVIDFDLASFRSVAGPVRDRYTAKNPLIADFHAQSKDL